eukprot:TRINITY_DN21674_c0_g1_i1.p4 TRINITY_DN21674_c0_g1~~TRINITY_DN21674_c0_g1_i1.p4  ORF type:complete len:226 (+),score=55.74 TRINITY_DN21674_c0_g1_i1:65-679(+)
MLPAAAGSAQTRRSPGRSLSPRSPVQLSPPATRRASSPRPSPQGPRLVLPPGAIQAQAERWTCTPPQRAPSQRLGSREAGRREASPGLPPPPPTAAAAAGPAAPPPSKPPDFNAALAVLRRQAGLPPASGHCAFPESVTGQAMALALSAKLSMLSSQMLGVAGEGSAPGAARDRQLDAIRRTQEMLLDTAECLHRVITQLESPP